MSRPHAKKARPAGAKTSAPTHPLVPAFRSLELPFIVEAGRPELIRLDRACQHGNFVIVGLHSEEAAHVVLLVVHPIKTVAPAQFETLLMSPALESWTKQLRYVIFDEVHCIGESSEGAKWERLLAMLQTPFVALSATVGNPQQFLDFLNAVQRAQGRKVKLIEYVS